MAITVYYDASGNEKNSLFMSIVGVAASPESWPRFDAEWKAVLDAAGVREFHHTDYKASEGEFKKWKGKHHEPERRRFMGALLDVLERYAVHWFSGGMYVRTFASVGADFDLDAFAGPYML